MAHSYEVRSVHKIRPSHTDVTYIGRIDVDLATLDTKALAKALRDLGHLVPGQRLYESRVEADGRIVAFPTNHGGITCYPRVLIIRPLAETLYYVDRGRVDVTAIGNYGSAREYTLLDALDFRPYCAASAPTVLTLHEVLYTGTDDRERHVREVGGFFVDAGAEWSAPSAE